MQLSYTMGQASTALPQTANSLGLPTPGLLQYASAALLLAAVIAVGVWAYKRRSHHRRDVRAIKTMLKQDRDLDVPTITYLLEKAHPDVRYAERDVARLMKRLAAKGEVASDFVDSVESYAPVRRAVYSLRN